MDINALVVDDNEVNTFILTNMLKSYGIHADRAGSGCEAVRMSLESAYDLFFIDHFMPGMNGIQTTLQLRSLPCNQKSVMIALTSDITGQLTNEYATAGADGLFEKPLRPTDFIFILKKWYPGSRTDVFDDNNCYRKNELIQTMIETIEDIDYQTGIQNALYNPDLYVRVLELSLKELRSCKNKIINSLANHAVDDMIPDMHTLINILSNIGAVRLAEEAGHYEKALLMKDYQLIAQEYEECVKRLESLHNKLRAVIDRYYSLLSLRLSGYQSDCVPMTAGEYEQCLEKAIYYIRRYEYGPVIEVLKDLIARGEKDNIPEFEQAYREVNEYHYEKALKRLLRLQ